MKKKTYEQPHVEIIEVKAADIICTSGFPSEQNEEWEFGTTDEWYNI